MRCMDSSYLTVAQGKARGTGQDMLLILIQSWLCARQPSRPNQPSIGYVYFVAIQ